MQSSMPAKRKNKGGRPRDMVVHATIIKATEQLIRQHGYAQTTMEKIATRAGVSRATLYRWWDGKGQLVIEALMSRRPRVPKSITDDFHAGLEELIDTMVYNTLSPHNVDALLGLEYDSRYDKKLEKTLADSRVESTDIIKTLLDTWKEQGLVDDSIDEDIFYHLLYGGRLTIANHAPKMKKEDISRKFMAFFESTLLRA